MIPSLNRSERRRGEALTESGLDPDKTPERATQRSPMDGDPLLDARGRRRYLGNISEMTAWRWERDYALPPPDLVVARRRFWRLSTLDAWIATRRAAPTAA